MSVRAESEMLALLVAQAEERGGDLVMIRALVEEASDLGAARTWSGSGWRMQGRMRMCANCGNCCAAGAMPNARHATRR